MDKSLSLLQLLSTDAGSKQVHSGGLSNKAAMLSGMTGYCFLNQSFWKAPPCGDLKLASGKVSAL